MKLAEKVGNLLMIGIEGKSLSPEESKFLTQYNIGGVCLFSRNLETPDQISELCQQIQDTRIHSANKAPLFISIDMEGGRVQRLKEPYTIWPSMSSLGEIDSSALSYKFAEAMGEELRATGINMNFSPCVDIFTEPKNQIIGDRAFGSSAELVGKHASAVIRGFLNSGIIACAKHFPGHGNTIADSHEELPIEELTWEELEAREIQAFKKAFRARVDFTMTAHILYKNIDAENPVTFSSKFLKQLLPATGYKKLVITDDLDMKALSLNYEKQKIPIKSLEAGAHYLLYCNEPDSPPLAIESIVKAVEEGRLSQELIHANYEKLMAVKLERIKQIGPFSKADRDAIIGSDYHKDLAEHMRNRTLPEGIST